MRRIRNTRKTSIRRERTGAAVVEFAVVAPLLALILVGSIDVGQAINVAQVVNEASREAARQGARFDTKSDAQVKTAVQDYIRRNSSGMANADVAVNFVDSSGTAVPNGDLTTVPSGTSLEVRVVVKYDSVRWLSALPLMNGRSIATTTIMRRE